MTPRHTRPHRESAPRPAADALESRTLLNNTYLGYGTVSDIVFDSTRDLLYVAAGASIHRYNPADQTQVFDPIEVSQSMRGFDITPDGTALYVADGEQAGLHRVSLSSGAVSFVPVPLGPGEYGTYDVAISGNGKALVSTAGANTYFDKFNLRELTLAGNAVRPRPDLGTVTGGGAVTRSPDRSTAVILNQEHPLFDTGQVRVYDAASNALSANVTTNTLIYASQAAIAPGGAQFAIHSRPGAKAYSRAVAQRQALPDIDGGMVFDPTRPVFYGVNSATSTIIAYDANTWQEKFRFPAGAGGVEGVGDALPLGRGTMAITDDGSTLFLVTDDGVRVIDVPPNPAQATTLTLGGFSTFVRRNVASTFTVTLLDGTGRPAADYRGTVHFTSDDLAAALPADYTFTAADAGSHTFTATLKTAGVRSITAIDVANSSLVATQSGITVHAGQVGFVPLAGGQELIYDPVRNTLYVTTSAGQLQRYVLNDETLLPAVQAGVSLSGGDVTPDGSTLYLAEAAYNPAVNTQPGRIRKVDAATGAVTTLEFPMKAFELAAADLAIAPNGRALLTTSSYHNTPVPVRQINLATGAITVRGDHGEFADIAGGGVETRLSRGPDRRRFVFQAYNGVTNQAVYDADANAFPPVGGLTAVRPAAVSRDGSLLSFQLDGTVITDPLLRTITKFAPRIDGAPRSSLEGGMAFDPARDLFYAVDAVNDQVVAIDTNTWKEKYRVPVGEDVGDAGRVGPGQLSVSADGRKLFLLTAAGVRVINTRVPNGLAADFHVSGFREFGPAGMPGAFTVTVLDAAGEPATEFRGTIAFASTDPAANLPGSYTFTAADAGRKTFTATFNTPGDHQMRIVSAAAPSLVLAFHAGITIHDGSVSLIPAAEPRDVVYDPLRNLLYVTTASGKILRYDTATKSLLSPLDAGVPLNGADLGADNNSLFVAEDIDGVATGVIRRFDLTGNNPGPYSAVHYLLGQSELGAFDVAVAADGTALFSTRSRFPRWQAGYRRFDTATGVDGVAASPTAYFDATVAASADRSAILRVDGDAAIGLLGVYESSDPDASPTIRQNGEGTTPVVGAANRNGTLFAVPGIRFTVYDRNLNIVRRLPALDGGVAFDPAHDRFYGVDVPRRQVVAYETDGWRELYRIPLGGNYAPFSQPMVNGMTAVSDDGRLLFLTDANQGVRVYALPAPPPLGVAAANVFYNHSAFDGNSAAANAADDNAVATDKHPLLPGQPVSAANYTSYTKGLNGLMIDLVGLDPFTDPAAADFAFQSGTADNSATWANAAAPTVAVRRGAGASGSARVTFTWPDGAIRNTWLRVTVKPTAAAGLGAPGVFYFGNLVGDTGPAPTAQPATVDAADLARTRAAQSPRRVAITSPFDHNRDGHVNAPDLAAVRANDFTTLPAPQIPPAAGAPPRTATRRTAYAESAATGLLRDS